LPVDARQRGEGRRKHEIGKGRGSGWHVYILRCRDDTLYTGITTDVTRRLQEHNGSPRGAAYTRGRRPVRLVWSASAVDRRDATVGERALKRLTRDAKERLIAVKLTGQRDAQALHYSRHL